MKRTVTMCLTAGLIFAVGCGHGSKVKIDPGAGTASTEADNKGLVAQTMWVKNKKEAIDIYLTLTNNYPHAINFKKSAINMTYNGKPTRLKKSNFSGEMAAGGLEKEVVMFTADGALSPTGKAVITIDPIYEESDKAADKQKKLPPLTLALDVHD